MVQGTEWEPEKHNKVNTHNTPKNTGVYSKETEIEEEEPMEIDN